MGSTRLQLKKKSPSIAMSILLEIMIVGNSAVADPGFPRGGDANSPGEAPTYEFAKFSQKLHEIERIWTPGGHASFTPLLPLRSATAQSIA